MIIFFAFAVLHNFINSLRIYNYIFFVKSERHLNAAAMPNNEKININHGEVSKALSKTLPINTPINKHAATLIPISDKSANPLINSLRTFFLF